jgi:PIN domain nuclease of toxin-antitoxin system
MQMNSILLDTHVFLWIMMDSEELTEDSRTFIQSLLNDHKTIYLSAISVWEIAMLHSKNRIHLTLPVGQWITQALQAPCIELLPLTPDISIESTVLPGTLHADPADRIIVATARIHNHPLLTRDSKILNYAKEGFLNAFWK